MCSLYCTVSELLQDQKFPEHRARGCLRARRLASVPAGFCGDYRRYAAYSAASGDGNSGRGIGDRVCGGSSARPLAL